MRKRYLRLIIIVGILAAVFMLIRYTKVHHYFSLSALKDENHFLKNMITHNYGMAVLMYIALFFLVICLAIPGTPALTLLGGYLFGFFEGASYALIGSVSGAILSFLLFRYVLNRYVGTWYGARIDRFKVQMHEHGASYLLLLHFITVVPYVVINALAAVTDVSLATLTWTTIVGSFPIVCIYAFTGRQLSYIESARDIFSPGIIVAFILLIVMACAPIVIRKLRTSLDI